MSTRTSEGAMKLRDALQRVSDFSSKAWVYLPREGSWNLDSECAILENEEVPPELEDDPSAGVPDFAKRHNLRQVLPVTVVQDIVANVHAQKSDAKLEDLVGAFLYYFQHDAFMDLTKGSL